MTVDVDALERVVNEVVARNADAVDASGDFPDRASTRCERPGYSVSRRRANVVAGAARWPMPRS